MSTLKLAAELNSTVQSIGAELSAKKKLLLETRHSAHQQELKEQIRQASIVADRLIQGLPTFLRQCAEAEYDKAYVVCRSGCQPWESYFPGYTQPDRRSDYNKNNMTEYAVRRYMKGTIQRVALWGLKQDLRVGVTYIADSRDIESSQRRHHGVINVYMPGMFYNYIPTGLNADLLYFAW